MTTPPLIEGYEIIGKIADGGMSTVWKAKQLSLDRIVALKVLHEDLVKAGRDVERFKSEARSAATLRHSGLCEIYDAGETPDGSVYYAMEYVAGFSIHQLLLRKGTLAEKQALLVTQGAAQVLAAIWDKNHLIHCDIKPDNILIDQDGTIRVTDLGLSRVISRMAANTDEGYIVGTPNYMSPEQARGSDDLDFRTDVYGLGATLYQMLTGMMPFADADGDLAAERQIQDYVADPQALNPDISHAAACLLEKMLMKDRLARYHTWQELIQDIEEVRAGRLPRGGLVPVGQSTVSRSADREAATQKLIDEMQPKRPEPVDTAASEPIPSLPTPGAKPKPAPRPRKGGGPRKPVGKSGSSQLKLRPSSPAPRSRQLRLMEETWGQAAQKTFLLLVLVGGTYAGSFYFLGRHQASHATTVTGAPTHSVEQSAAHPAPSPIRPPAPSPQPAVQQPRPQRPQPAPSPAPEPRAAPSWDHPEYIEALNLIEQGQHQLRQFQQHGNAALLDPIEPEARRAIGMLNRLRSDAPDEARVTDHVQQAFQLINNAREARLLLP